MTTEDRQACGGSCEARDPIETYDVEVDTADQLIALEILRNRRLEIQNDQKRLEMDLLTARGQANFRESLGALLPTLVSTLLPYLVPVTAGAPKEGDPIAREIRELSGMLDHKLVEKVMEMLPPEAQLAVMRIFQWASKLPEEQGSPPAA